MCFFAYVISQKGSKLQGKKHAEHCLRHLNKTACEIWSVFDKVLFCVKYLTPFFHRTFNYSHHFDCCSIVDVALAVGCDGELYIKKRLNACVILVCFCRYVIHTVGPRYNIKYKTAAESALYSSYRSVMKIVRCVTSLNVRVMLAFFIMGNYMLDFFAQLIS